MNLIGDKKIPDQPQGVLEEEAERVLEFLNTAKTAAEIAGAIEISGERDIGIRLAQKILDRGRELGGFKNLTEVADIPQVGSKRFTQIVAALGDRTYTGGRFGMILDSKEFVGFMKTVSGGNIKGKVAVYQWGVIQRKHISTISYEPITVEVGMGMSEGFYEWISGSFDGRCVTESGEIHACDFNYRSKSVREFLDAHISEVTIPALDGSSKEPAYMTVELEPERIDYKRGDGGQVQGQGIIASVKKPWLCSNFRFTLGALPCSRVAKIDSFTWKQGVIKDEVGAFRIATKHPAKVEVPNIKVTISMADVDAWQDWFRTFVIDGKCTDSDELSGAITFLGPDLNEQLAEIELLHVGVISMEISGEEANKEELAQFAVELYVEEMKFDYKVSDA